MRADFGGQQQLEGNVDQRMDGIEGMAGTPDDQERRVGCARRNGAPRDASVQVPPSKKATEAMITALKK